MELQPDQVERIIRAYLPQVIHMSLGTSAGNKPWVCEVHYAFDDELNLYFASMPGTRHCQEIAQNPHVAGNIVTQHHLNQAVRGVYFEGTAQQVERADQADPGFQAYASRFADRGPAILEAADDPAGLRLYKITISDFYLFDGYESKPWRKYHLDWKK